MFYIKEGFPTARNPRIAKVTISNMFAACTVCGKEVHLTPETVTTQIRRLMSDSYLCPKCFNKLVCELCDDDEGDDEYYDFDDEDEEDDDDADDDPEYEDDLESCDEDEELFEDESDDAEVPDAAEDRGAELSEAEFGEVRHKAITKLNELIYGNPEPRVENIMYLQEIRNIQI